MAKGGKMAKLEEEPRSKEGEDEREPVHEELHHEDKDINLRAIVIFSGALALLVAISALGLYQMMNLMLEAEARADRPLSMLREKALKLPPEPRLQVNTRIDLRELHTHEDEILNSYGMAPDGRVRIPIERAMDIVARRGLGKTREHNPAPLGALPSESSLGTKEVWR